MKSDAIQEYILKNKENLRIASAVGEAWPEVRQKLVSGFLDRLESRLKKKLKSWEFEQYGRFFVDGDAGLQFLKPAWKNQYSITLQFRDLGERMAVGVVRDYPHIGKSPFCEALLTAVKGLYPSAAAYKWWWEARARLNSPAADWRKPKELWQMHKDNKFLEDVAEQLLRVAKISEPIIDSLARKK